MKVGQLFMVAVGALLAAACTSVPFDYPKEATQAVRTSQETYFGNRLAKWQSSAGADQSGSVMLLRGMDGLGSRLVMMERAEATIDAQYFLLKPDAAGRLFLGKLLRAADRGVRVRLLLDDIFTPRNDRALASFDSHPNIEVRLFNPASRMSPAAWSLLWDFSRVNRRMHNKAFIVDGSYAIMGGRNIADEYFELKPQQEFDDFEMLVFGAVVPDIADGFDRFWNSSLAVPMKAFRTADDPAQLERWRVEMDEVVSGSRPSPYAAAVGSPFLQQILDGEVSPYVSSAQLVYDSPRKLTSPRSEDEHRRLVAAVTDRLRKAQKEVIIITPYLVPGDLSYPLLHELRDRGVRVLIITNSLASTNHVAVHSAYGPRRKGMLEAGAEIYEIKLDDVLRDRDVGGFTLHTKAIIVDGEQLFVGSLNVDPRSFEINTEVGLFIDSPRAAADYRKIVLDDLPRYTYRVGLDERGRLQWHYQHGEVSSTQHREPGAGVWRRFKAAMIRLLPIEDQM